jgi:hypothetical protein
MSTLSLFSKFYCSLEDVLSLLRPMFLQRSLPGNAADPSTSVLTTSLLAGCRPVGLGVGLPSGAHDQIFVSCVTFSGFLDVGRPLWREEGSIIFSYNCYWVLPEQSLSGPSPSELTTIFYCLLWDFPILEGQIPVFISPRNRAAKSSPQGTGFPFRRLYYSQGHGGGILTRTRGFLLLHHMANARTAERTPFAAFYSRPLPNNCYCLESHYFPSGLHTTIRNSITEHAGSGGNAFDLY